MSNYEEYTAYAITRDGYNYEDILEGKAILPPHYLENMIEILSYNLSIYSDLLSLYVESILSDKSYSLDNLSTKLVSLNINSSVILISLHTFFFPIFVLIIINYSKIIFTYNVITCTIFKA